MLSSQVGVALVRSEQRLEEGGDEARVYLEEHCRPREQVSALRQQGVWPEYQELAGDRVREDTEAHRPLQHLRMGCEGIACEQLELEG